jgi:PilZ domain-containing protein
MSETRKHPRFPVHFGSTFSGEQIAGQGTIANLSIGGCSIESKVTLSAQSRLALHIDLPDSRWPLQIEGATVRWVRGNTFGLEFEQISPGSIDRLHRLVEDMQQGPLVMMRRTGV